MRSDEVSRRTVLKAIAAAVAGSMLPSSASVASDVPASRAERAHRILTCNILLDLPEQHGTSDDWPAHRRAVCEKVIKSHAPDILCLQEVGRGQYEDFVKAFQAFASFGYADPNTDRNPRRFQAIKNVILYSQERYEQTSAGTYWLSQTPLIAGSKLPGADLPRHVTWVRLKDRSSGRELRVLDTHWALKQPSREQEAKMIAEETGQYLPEFPQILAGDLNSQATSSEHKILTDAGWMDTYAAVHANTSPGAATAANTKPKKIDFIYCRGNIRPVAAQIIRHTENGIRPSDHPFVSADVLLS